MEEYLGQVDTEKLKVILTGTGQYGKLSLLDETKRLLEDMGIKSVELKTSEATGGLERWKNRERRSSEFSTQLISRGVGPIGAQEVDSKGLIFEEEFLSKLGFFLRNLFLRLYAFSKQQISMKPR